MNLTKLLSSECCPDDYDANRLRAYRTDFLMSSPIIDYDIFLEWGIPESCDVSKKTILEHETSFLRHISDLIDDNELSGKHCAQAIVRLFDARDHYPNNQAIINKALQNLLTGSLTQQLAGLRILYSTLTVIAQLKDSVLKQLKQSYDNTLTAPPSEIQKKQVSSAIKRSHLAIFILGLLSKKSPLTSNYRSGLFRLLHDLLRSSFLETDKKTAAQLNSFSKHLESIRSNPTLNASLKKHQCLIMIDLFILSQQVRSKNHRASKRTSMTVSVSPNGLHKAVKAQVFAMWQDMFLGMRHHAKAAHPEQFNMFLDIGIQLSPSKLVFSPSQQADILLRTLSNTQKPTPQQLHQWLAEAEALFRPTQEPDRSQAPHRAELIDIFLLLKSFFRDAHNPNGITLCLDRLLVLDTNTEHRREYVREIDAIFDTILLNRQQTLVEQNSLVLFMNYYDSLYKESCLSGYAEPAVPALLSEQAIHCITANIYTIFLSIPRDLYKVNNFFVELDSLIDLIGTASQTVLYTFLKALSHFCPNSRANTIANPALVTSETEVIDTHNLPIRNKIGDAFFPELHDTIFDTLLHTLYSTLILATPISDRLKLARFFIENNNIRHATRALDNVFVYYSSLKESEVDDFFALLRQCRRMLFTSNPRHLEYKETLENMLIISMQALDKAPDTVHRYFRSIFHLVLRLPIIESRAFHQRLVQFILMLCKSKPPDTLRDGIKFYGDIVKFVERLMSIPLQTSRDSDNSDTELLPMLSDLYSTIFQSLTQFSSSLTSFDNTAVYCGFILKSIRSLCIFSEELGPTESKLISKTIEATLKHLSDVRHDDTIDQLFTEALLVIIKLFLTFNTPKLSRTTSSLASQICSLFDILDRLNKHNNVSEHPAYRLFSRTLLETLPKLLMSLRYSHLFKDKHMRSSRKIINAIRIFSMQFFADDIHDILLAFNDDQLLDARPSKPSHGLLGQLIFLDVLLDLRSASLEIDSSYFSRDPVRMASNVRLLYLSYYLFPNTLTQLLHCIASIKADLSSGKLLETSLNHDALLPYFSFMKQDDNDAPLSSDPRHYAVYDDETSLLTTRRNVMPGIFSHHSLTISVLDVLNKMGNAYETGAGESDPLYLFAWVYLFTYYYNHGFVPCALPPSSNTTDTTDSTVSTQTFNNYFTMFRQLSRGDIRRIIA